MDNCFITSNHLLSKVVASQPSILCQTLDIEAIARTHHSVALLRFLVPLLRDALCERYAFLFEMMNDVLDGIFQYVNHLPNIFLFNVVPSLK